MSTYNPCIGCQPAVIEDRRLLQSNVSSWQLTPPHLEPRWPSRCTRAERRTPTSWRKPPSGSQTGRTTAPTWPNMGQGRRFVAVPASQPVSHPGWANVSHRRASRGYTGFHLPSRHRGFRPCWPHGSSRGRQGGRPRDSLGGCSGAGFLSWLWGLSFSRARTEGRQAAAAAAAVGRRLTHNPLHGAAQSETTNHVKMIPVQVERAAPSSVLLLLYSRG